jgi:hypothetical protein
VSAYSTVLVLPVHGNDTINPRNDTVNPEYDTAVTATSPTGGIAGHSSELFSIIYRS